MSERIKGLLIKPYELPEDIILPDLHGIDEFDQCCEVLFLDRRFIVDIADQCAVQQRLCFGPELVPGFAVALGVGDQCGDEL